MTQRATDIRVDWRRIMADLRQHHGSMLAVAAAARIPRQTLQRLDVEYAEPRYSDGRVLIALWAVAVTGDEASPPMIRVRDICEP